MVPHRLATFGFLVTPLLTHSGTWAPGRELLRFLIASFFPRGAHALLASQMLPSPSHPQKKAALQLLLIYHPHFLIAEARHSQPGRLTGGSLSLWKGSALDGQNSGGCPNFPGNLEETMTTSIEGRAGLESEKLPRRKSSGGSVFGKFIDF